MIFDTRSAVQRLRQGGMAEPEADAVVDVVKDATRDLVTGQELRAELHRALLIQAGVVLTGVAAIAAVATLLATLA